MNVTLLATCWVCCDRRTEENGEAHRINEQMSAEVVELTADVEQLEAKLDQRRESEYTKALDALTRHQDTGGADDAAADLLQQVSQLAEQLEHVTREKLQGERRLAQAVREHSSAIAMRHDRIGELERMLAMANAEIAALGGGGGGGGGSRYGRAPSAAAAAGGTGSGSGGRGDRPGASGMGYASTLDDIESGSSASESGDSYLSASSGAASGAAAGGGGSTWRMWPASAGPFASMLSARSQADRRTTGRSGGGGGAELPS